MLYMRAPDLEEQVCAQVMLPYLHIHFRTLHGNGAFLRAPDQGEQVCAICVLSTRLNKYALK